MAPLILIKIKNVTLLLAILSVVQATVFRAPKATIMITNALNGTASTAILNVHIKSKDDDIGWHAIPNGGQYELSFHPRWFGGTLFFSRMEWLTEFHYFDIYDQRRDQAKCDHCCWFVYPSGPCRYDCEPPASPEMACFPWDSKNQLFIS